MKKPFSGSASEKFLDTLAQSGTAQGDYFALSQGRVVYGAGSDLADKLVWQRRAKRKMITQGMILNLIKVAEKKEAHERVKAYWNTYHCQEKFFGSDGRVYGRYCKNRFCTVCCCIRKADIINRYLPEINTWEDPHFVTLTVKAVRASKLDFWLFGIKKAFRQIREKCKKNNQRGLGPKLIGIKSLECNFNPVSKTYNPHLHLIVPNAEIAKILTDEWLKKWTRKYTSPRAQHQRRVQCVERDLVELIKYGSKIFTEPDLNKKAGGKIPRMVYAAALDTIFSAMKPYRLFERFGFNLPKQPGYTQQAPTLLQQYDEWIFEPSLHDWHNPDTGELLTGFRPTPQLQWILAQSIDTDLQ